MKRLVLTFAILIGLAAPAWAGFAEGYAAYKRGDYATALRELRPLANQGDATAQISLGIIYALTQDHAEAGKWYRKAAAQGVAKAQYNLGAMYRKGEGAAQDYAEAVRWTRKAAEQGVVAAQFNLGVMYGKGQGVPQDYVQAHMWSNLAASRFSPGTDHAKAVKHRDIFAQLMTPAQIAEAQRLAREWKPKKEGK